MKRRNFIFTGIMAAIGAQMMTARKATAWILEAIIAMIVLTVGAVMLCKLLGLCRKLNKPKPPDKDDGHQPGLPCPPEPASKFPPCPPDLFFFSDGA